ncbi:MAG: ankyrin repeat domain-containing protein [Nitrospirota bacterium]
MIPFSRKVILSLIVLIASSAGIASAANLEKQFGRAVAAGDIENVGTLLDQGADVNAKNKEGETPLMVAALERRLEMVKFLLDRGADINLKDNVGATALIYSAMEGSVEIMKLLLDRGADPDAKTDDGLTALSISDLKGNREAVELLHRAKAKK